MSELSPFINKIINNENVCFLLVHLMQEKFSENYWPLTKSVTCNSVEAFHFHGKSWISTISKNKMKNTSYVMMFLAKRLKLGKALQSTKFKSVYWSNCPLKSGFLNEDKKWQLQHPLIASWWHRAHILIRQAHSKPEETGCIPSTATHIWFGPQPA